MKKILFILIFTIILPPSINAACVGASPTWMTGGNEYADVKACYDLASPGDTINIIAGDGDATWARSLTINKNINIIGPGAANLRLRHTTPLDIFQVTGSVTSLRISGFEFYTATSQRFLTLYNGDNWRIDNIAYTNINTGRGGTFVEIWINPAWGDHSYGVIDSNIILNGRIVHGGGQTIAAVRKLWHDDLNLGSNEAVYIENNVFTLNPSRRTNCLDSNRGSKYVFRYNSLHDTNTTMAHGLQEATGGARKWEFYGNKYHAELHGTGTLGGVVATWPRGGTGVIFGNDYTSDKPYNADIGVDQPRDVGYDPPYTYTDNTTEDGRCDGDHNIDGNEAINGSYYGTGTLGTGSHDAADGATLSDSTKAWVASRLTKSVVYNLSDAPAKCSITANTTDTAECVLSGGTRNHWHTGDTYKISDGWPCRDQPGVSKDATLATFWGDLTGNVQEKAPFYTWSNYRSSAASAIYIPSASKPIPPGTSRGHIQADRDYFHYTTSFNGSSGTGCGTLVQMNAITPTLTGVGFWVPTNIDTMPCRPAATNVGAESEGMTTPITGTLYKWSGTAWKIHYTPYQYPHPLRSGVTTPYPLSRPAPPLNLKISN